MLEMNNWFFVLLALFLSLIFILNQILFKPLLAVFREREAAIDGAKDEAQKMGNERETKLDQLKKDLSEGSAKSKEAFEGLREGGLEKQRELMETANKEAMRILEEARAALAQETEKARTALSSDAEKYASDIAGKLLKV